MKRLTLVFALLFGAISLNAVTLIPLSQQDKEEQYKYVCELAGVDYIGIQDFGIDDIPVLILFNARSGTTLALEQPDFSLEAVIEKVKQSEVKFKGSELVLKTEDFDTIVEMNKIGFNADVLRAG